MTTWAKKLGGPTQLLLSVAIGGYVVFRISEAGVKKVIKIVRDSPTKKASDQAKTCIVHTKCKSNEGLEFKVGDKFNVLEIDGDAVLIEKIGDSDNPYFVSTEFLSAISNFNL